MPADSVLCILFWIAAAFLASTVTWALLVADVANNCPVN